MKVWAQKVRDRERQLYYQRMHHKEAQRTKATGAALDLFSPTHRHAHFRGVSAKEKPKMCAELEEAGPTTISGLIGRAAVKRLL